MLSRQKAGENCASQVVDAIIVGGATGAFAGAIQAAWVAKPQVINRTAPLVLDTVGKVGRGSAFFGVAAVVYQGGTCFLAGMRGKDDALNPAIGGALAGSLYGVTRGCVNTSIGGMFIGGLLASFAKMAKDNGKLERRPLLEKTTGW